METNNYFYQIKAPSMCTPREGDQSSQRLQLPRELSPASAQGSCPARAALVGDGRINVRKLRTRIKPQTISGWGIR